MSTAITTIDTKEINQFAQYETYWWDKDGPLRTLHDVNAVRLQFISQHAVLEGHWVLDVGCGGGILAEAMVLSGAQVTGIDAEEKAIQVAREHAQELPLNLDYFCMPIEEYEQGPFDVITCMELLEHVSNPQCLIQHCKRLLKPGGFLFVSTLNRTLKAYAFAVLAAEYVLNLIPKQTHEYQKFITPSELVAMARAHDLSLVDMQGLAYNPFTRTAFLSSDVRVNYVMVFQNEL